jgi:hypothetical protein
VRRMRTDEHKRALRDRDGQAPLTYYVTSSVAARLPRRASCLLVPLTEECFCRRPKARTVGGPEALSSRRFTGGGANVTSGPVASRT